MNLKVYDICSSGCQTLGPGNRYVIWTQGCLHRCKGCITPESQSLDAGWDIDINVIASDIKTNPNITGITISGGEPFLQAKQLAILLEQIFKSRPELNTIIYTGYTIESLLGEDDVNLLSKIDLLIDGQYIESLNDGIGLRGSSNQRLHFLSDRLLPYKTELESGKRKIEMHIYANKIVKYGIPIKNNQMS